MTAVTAVSKPNRLTLGFRATDALAAGDAVIVLDIMVINEDSGGDALDGDQCVASRSGSTPKSVSTRVAVKDDGYTLDVGRARITERSSLV